MLAVCEINCQYLFTTYLPFIWLTIEVDSADVAEQLFAVDVGHARAEARVPVAELPVHVVQGVGHGVHGIHHELNLAFLLVAGVPTNFF